jgi:hypothetical protein
MGAWRPEAVRVGAFDVSRFARRPDRREFCAMSTKFKLDMPMMYAVHDAFRRDLERVAEMTTRSEGWEVFGHFLRVHHEAEANFDPSYESLPLEEFRTPAASGVRRK